MKKTAALFISFMLLSAVALAVEKPLGMEEFTSVNELATAISSYFPTIQGDVTTVQQDMLTVAIGSNDGLKAGVTLTLWRAGREIPHPITGAVLGRTEAEEEIADAKVVEVGEHSSIVRIIKKQKDPKPGDTARLTPNKITLALIPLKPDRVDVVRELGDRLNKQGRFAVLESGKVAVFLKDRAQRDSALIKEMGITLGVEVIAAVDVYPSEGDKLLVTTRLFYADDARPVATIQVRLDLKSKTTEKKVTEILPFNAQLFAVADLEGNGTLHYVFSDGSRLHIFQRESSGWREEWSETQWVTSAEMQYINIDVADINGTGKPEIFVTAMRNEKVISYVMKFQDGSCHRIAEMPGFLRVVKFLGKGNVLIGQDYDPNSFYSGEPRQYSWSDGKYVAGREFRLPRGVDLYGFVVANMEKAHPLLVALNNDDQLMVYSNNNAIWKGEGKYLTPSLTVAKPLEGVDAAFRKSAAEQADKTGEATIFLNIKKFKIKGRILALDMNGNGKEDIFIPKNSSVTGLTDAEIVGLSWTGSRLEQRFSIKNINGIIMDFQVMQRQGVDPQFLVLMNIPGRWFKKDTTQVMSYTVK